MSMKHARNEAEDVEHLVEAEAKVGMDNTSKMHMYIFLTLVGCALTILMACCWLCGVMGQALPNKR